MPDTRDADANPVRYYDEDALFGRTSKDTVTRTTFPIIGEGVLYPKRGDHNLQPHGTKTWYVSGPEGNTFSTALTFEGGGGHSHNVGSNDPRATGTMNPPSGTITGEYPQNIPQVYRAGATCGRVRDDTTVGGTAYQEFYNIAIGGLQALSESTGVVLVGSTGTHPSNHWGTPGICGAIRTLGAAFHAQYTKPIYVNDMSLQTGGLFDIQGNFASPHQTHQDGRHADMNWSSMTEGERIWFKAKAEEIGFHVEVHPSPNHWHLRFG